MSAIKLDVHAHLIPTDGMDNDEFEGVSWEPQTQRLSIDGHEIGVKALFEPARLISWMERERVDHAFISAPPPAYRQQLRGKDARLWSEHLTNGLKKVAEARGEKLTALAHLPTQDPVTAAQLAKNWTERGYRHFSMPSGTGDERTLSDPAFEDLWKVLDDASAFVFFHPGECADGRLQSFYLGNLLGNPQETGVAISHLLLGGALDRYTNVVFCFAHGGGTAPIVAARIQRGFDTKRPGMNTTLQPPRLLQRRILVDCICHSEANVALAEETFGKENVVFGSDWPFPMGIPEPQQSFQSYNADRVWRIFCDNPDKLLATFKK
jgi:aminocarboxymuconate-semialdehyde decarboxylase